jgi:hypothetical protein
MDAAAARAAAAEPVQLSARAGGVTLTSEDRQERNRIAQRVRSVISTLPVIIVYAAWWAWCRASAGSRAVAID